MQVVRDLNAKRHGERRAFRSASTRTTPPSAPSGTRAITNFRAAITAAFRRAEMHLRARVIARAEAAALNEDFASGQSR